MSLVLGLAVLLLAAACGDDATSGDAGAGIDGALRDAALRDGAARDGGTRDGRVDPEPDGGPPGELFPLAASGDQRHLVTAGGRPFFIQGDTPWSLVVELSREEASAYLDDRAARGFNTILLNLIEHRFSSNSPAWANVYGDEPFTDLDDFSTANEAYFAHADWVLDEAERRGLLVLATPAYIGYGCGDEGWCARMRANDLESLRAYGRFLGGRYREQANIVWVHAGDHRPSASGSPSDWDRMDAIRQGLEETDRPDRIVTVHFSRGESGSEAEDARSWLTLDSIYSADGASIYEESLDAWDRSRGVRPTILFEAYYENEHGTTPRVLRSQMYWPVLAGATGFMYGNYPIWPFWNEGDPAWGFGDGSFGGDWMDALDNPGASSARVAGEFFRGIDWQRLVPDIDHVVMTGGFGSSGSADYALLAVTDERDLAVAYLYDASLAPEIDLGAFAGAMVSARWVDPSSGASTDIAGSPFPSEGTMTFSPPGDNAQGFGDWLLVLSSAP